VRAKLYAWRIQGDVFAGVVVKLGLRWSDGCERMDLAGPVPIVDEVRHHKDNFAHSPIYPTDVVPYRPRADLILDATAHPAARATTVMPRLVLERGGETVIDKRLLVATPSGPVGLRWEHTHRGPDNPYGGAEPRVTDPSRPHEPAGFGPEPLVVQRQRFPKAPDGLFDLPSGTSAEVFQSAPVDQRCPHFDGSESLTLEGMHPQHPHLRLRLPSFHAHAVVAEAPATRWSPLRMAADMLAVQPASQTAVMTWRGWLALPSVEALRRLRWVATIAGPEETVGWPSVADVARGPSEARAVAVPTGDETADSAAPSEMPSPFAISASRRGRGSEAPLPGAPWDRGPAPLVERPLPGDTTAEPVGMPNPFDVVPPSDAMATIGTDTEEPSTRRPDDGPFAADDAPVIEQRREAEQQQDRAESEALRREVAAQQAQERERFEAEEAERRGQDERRMRLEAERDRRAHMMDRLYGFKLQDE